MRRLVAVVVLLAAAVLLHFGMPHHASDTSNAASAMAPATEPEARKPGSASATAHVGTVAQHHQAGAEALALPPRTGHPVETPSLAAHAIADQTPLSLTAASGPAHPRTARDVWNPGAGLAPTPSTLQTFRC
ncbi:hypothetical protein OHA74_12870 [Streptomyces phaeochromogenes]|uniref:hypothetical protein n=1 Tax=Streptomyces phaeochromogenes TaxID=1923 RepID=UPI002E2E5C03|nr:hypothetical protein [Streptomyces phaeochromogenes]